MCSQVAAGYQNLERAQRWRCQHGQRDVGVVCDYLRCRLWLRFQISIQVSNFRQTWWNYFSRLQVKLTECITCPLQCVRRRPVPGYSDCADRISRPELRFIVFRSARVPRCVFSCNRCGTNAVRAIQGVERNASNGDTGRHRQQSKYLIVPTQTMSPINMTLID